jgi:hypothetical protein
MLRAFLRAAPAFGVSQAAQRNLASFDQIRRICMCRRRTQARKYWGGAGSCDILISLLPLSNIL